jgi:hypothetical protein
MLLTRSRWTQKRRKARRAPKKIGAYVIKMRRWANCNRRKKR